MAEAKGAAKGDPSALLAAAETLGAGTVQIVEAGAPAALNPLAPVLVYGVSGRTGPDLLERLRRLYSPEHPIRLLTADSSSPATAPLGQLSSADLDRAEGLWIDPSAPELAPASPHSLRAIVHRLRAPGGCPWDRQQTPASLARFVLEEAYEVVDAIETEGAAELRDELGDLLLQVYLQSELAEEQGAFDFDDVAGAISAKLVRRHPHVFADWQVSGAGEVELNWEQLKQQERGGPAPLLAGIPRAMPALSRAQELQRKLKRAGFDWPDRAGVLVKLDEELAELRASLDTPSALEGELGDVLFMLARLAGDAGLEAERALEGTIRRVAARFEYVEQALAARGQTFTDLPLDEVLELWQRAKSTEAASDPAPDAEGR